MSSSSQIPTAPSLAQRAGLRWVGAVLWCATVLLVTGLFAPLMTVEKFWVFENQVSLWSGLVTLFQRREVPLFLIILVFSILFPLSKILGTAWIWYSPWSTERSKQRWVHRIEELGRWSMLDVFVTALLVVTIKLGQAATVHLHSGIYIFAASVLLSMLASRGVRKALTAMKSPARDAAPETL